MIGIAGTDTNANHLMGSRSTTDFKYSESEIVSYVQYRSTWISCKCSVISTCTRCMRQRANTLAYTMSKL